MRRHRQCVDASRDADAYTSADASSDEASAHARADACNGTDKCAW